MTTNGTKWSYDCRKKRDDRERNMKIYVLKHFCGFNAALIADLFDLSPQHVNKVLRCALPAAPIGG